MGGFGFCHLSLVPVRKEPAHSSELVTQLLFGEVFSYGKNEGNFVAIKNAGDDYIGWLHHKQYLSISKNSFEKLKNPKNFFVSAEMQSAMKDVNENIIFPIPAGSRIPKGRAGRFVLEGHSFQYYGEASGKIPLKEIRKKIITTALQFLRTPYLWGGKSEMGIDCSGFTQVVYSINGIFLPRDAYQQAELGNTRDFVEQSLPGDLAFFHNENGKITHVGIVLENQKIIHASGMVRIDDLDLKGIKTVNTENYSHFLRSINNII